MIFISHRGNLYGQDKTKENSIDSVNLALSLGFDVEVDVWFRNDRFYLGHDEPQYYIDKTYLANPNIWCHAKSTETLFAFKDLDIDIHYFWHEQDSYTITSKGYIWSYVGMPISKFSINVLPEKIYSEIPTDIKYSLGICSDNIALYREKICK